MSDTVELAVGQWLILKLSGGLIEVVHRSEKMTRTTLAANLSDALAYLRGWGVEV